MSLHAIDVHSSQEMVIVPNPTHHPNNLALNRPQNDIKVEETMKIHDKFDVFLETIVENAKQKSSVSEIATLIPSVSQRIQGSCTFDHLFLILIGFLKWYDTENLTNVCANLKMCETLRNYEVDARKYLQDRIFSSLDPELVMPGQNVARQCVTEQTRNETLGVPHETLKLIIDGAWDIETLKEDCDKVCRKIVSIYYGRPSINNKTISGTFNNSTLYINIYC